MFKGSCLALASLVVGYGTAWAGPPSTFEAKPPIVSAPIVLAANGCGPGFYRTIAGECLPNARVRVGPYGQAVVLPPPCPRGFRRDPDPRRPICYPVY